MSVENILLHDSVIRNFPKIELHRHLEGTFSVPTLHRMALRNGLPFPEDLQEFKQLVQFPRDSEPDFLKFLSLFKNDWYRTLDDVAEITYESVQTFADDGIFYIELRFSPEHFAHHNGFNRDEVTRTVVDAANAAAEETGIEIRYLITLNRGKQKPDGMIELYNVIRSLGLDSIVGFDLAGDETNFPPEIFASFFEQVANDGIYQSTIHAGEVTPPAQIWEAVRSLRASRIGHGVSAIQDESLLQYLTDHSIALEQCLTSNYQTGAWTDERTHPMGALYRKGVPVTINSDDPFIQDTDLSEDYAKVATYFDFGIDDFVNVNLRALDAAFVADDERRDLRARYLQAVERFRANYDI